MKKVLFIILIIVCISTFVLCGFKLYTIISEPTNADLKPVVTEPQVETTIPSTETAPTETTEVTIEPTEPEFINSKIVDWQNINSNVVGTIAINDHQEEPIVQTADQNEYLHKNLNGEFSWNGTFFTAQGSIFAETLNTTIFGHTMHSGAMFGELYKYKDLDYLIKHPTFNISGIHGDYTCKIIGVLLPSANYELNGWYYPDPTVTENEFNNFKFQIRSRSLIDIPDEMNFESRYVMLSACSYNASNERLVIVGRIMSDNETVDTSTWEYNDCPLRCKEYYSEHNAEEPSIETLTEHYTAFYGHN